MLAVNASLLRSLKAMRPIPKDIYQRQHQTLGNRKAVNHSVASCFVWWNKIWNSVTIVRVPIRAFSAQSWLQIFSRGLKSSQEWETFRHKFCKKLFTQKARRCLKKQGFATSSRTSSRRQCEFRRNQVQSVSRASDRHHLQAKAASVSSRRQPAVASEGWKIQNQYGLR